MDRRLFIASGAAAMAGVLSGRPVSGFSDNDGELGSPRRFIELPQPISWRPPGEMPKVIEIFWYGCQHCYAFELALRRRYPGLATWQEHLVRMPAMFDLARRHARAYFSAQSLGVLDEFHWAFFRAIHEQGNSMSGDEDIARFFGTLGIARERFARTESSSAVANRLDEARELSRQAKVEFVPWLVVNGRFTCSPRSAGGNEALLLLVDELLNR